MNAEEQLNSLIKKENKELKNKVINDEEDDLLGSVSELDDFEKRLKMSKTKGGDNEDVYDSSDEEDDIQKGIEPSPVEMAGIRKSFCK